MKKGIFILISILLLTHLAYTTVQIPDYLIYDGSMYRVWGFRLSDKMNENKKKYLEKTGTQIMSSSANWDGIYVSLLISDKKLYIISIDFDYWKGEGVLSCKNVFGIDIPEQGLFADWYSGELRTGFWTYRKGESSHTFVFENGILKEVVKGAELQEELQNPFE